MVKIIKENAPKDYADFVEIVVDFGFDGIDDDKDPVQVWNRYIELIGDVIFVCSDYVFINEYSSTNRTVYYYEFKPKPSFSPWSPDWAKGAIHGDEIAFVFGLPVLAQQLYTLKEIELSRTVMNAWTKFAKSGSVVDF